MSAFWRLPGGSRRRSGHGSSTTAASPLFSKPRQALAIFGSDRSLPEGWRSTGSRDNGVAKNRATNRRCKKAVRILKKLCLEMDKAGIASAGPMSFFLIERLVWNVLDHHFGLPALRDMVKEVIHHLWSGAQTDALCGAWTEADGVKPLFQGFRSPTRVQANRFLIDAWHCVEDQ